MVTLVFSLRALRNWHRFNRRTRLDISDFLLLCKWTLTGTLSIMTWHPSFLQTSLVRLIPWPTCDDFEIHRFLATRLFEQLRLTFLYDWSPTDLYQF